MQTVIIVVHLMVVLALVLVVLLQRSEGGALGIGGGGGFMSSRGSANVLTRATSILAIAFFATSLGLALLARQDDRPGSLLDAPPGGQTAPVDGAPATGQNLLDQLKGAGEPQAPAPAPSGPQVPPAQ